jgi:hypothetical protein
MRSTFDAADYTTGSAPKAIPEHGVSNIRFTPGLISSTASSLKKSSAQVEKFRGRGPL